MTFVCAGQSFPHAHTLFVDKEVLCLSYHPQTWGRTPSSCRTRTNPTRACLFPQGFGTRARLSRWNNFCSWCPFRNNTPPNCCTNVSRRSCDVPSLILARPVTQASGNLCLVLVVRECRMLLLPSRCNTGIHFMRRDTLRVPSFPELDLLLSNRTRSGPSPPLQISSPSGLLIVADSHITALQVACWHVVCCSRHRLLPQLNCASFQRYSVSPALELPCTLMEYAHCGFGWVDASLFGWDLLSGGGLRAQE